MREVRHDYSLPPDAHWNAVSGVVEFGIGIGEYEGSVRVPREVFRRLIDGAVTPEKCVEAYHLQRICFERIAERKVRRRHLTDDGNVEICGRDFREHQTPRPQRPSLWDIREAA